MICSVTELVNRKASCFLHVLSYFFVNHLCIILLYPQYYQRTVSGTKPNESQFLLPKLFLLDILYKAIRIITIYQNLSCEENQTHVPRSHTLQRRVLCSSVYRGGSQDTKWSHTGLKSHSSCKAGVKFEPRSQFLITSSPFTET